MTLTVTVTLTLTLTRYADGGPASDPRVGQYAGKRMNYPAWWIDPDYEDDVHDQVRVRARARARARARVRLTLTQP